MSSIGDRLKAERLAAGLTLEQAGVIAGVSKQAISQIEKKITKNPEAATLEPLSRHLGINLQWLMTGKGPKRGTPTAPDSTSPDLQALTLTVAIAQELASHHRMPGLLSNPSVVDAAYRLATDARSATPRQLAERLARELGAQARQDAQDPPSGSGYVNDDLLKTGQTASSPAAPDPVMLAAAYQWTLIGIALFGGPTLKLSLASDAKWVSEVYSIVVRGGGAPLGRESSPELEAVIHKRAQELGTPTHDRHTAEPARGRERRRV